MKAAYIAGVLSAIFVALFLWWIPGNGWHFFNEEEIALTIIFGGVLGGFVAYIWGDYIRNDLKDATAWIVILIILVIGFMLVWGDDLFYDWHDFEVVGTYFLSAALLGSGVTMVLADLWFFEWYGP